MPVKPVINSREIIAKTRLFAVEALELTFSNGEQRSYERLIGGPHGAVLVVPMIDPETVLMILEYSAGTDRYELALPKGRLEAGESMIDGANRELAEEIGYAAHTVTELNSFTISPGYMSHSIEILLAEDLYEKTAVGDEPEPLEVVPIKLAELHQVIQREECSEARSIAALYAAKEHLQHRQ